MVMMTKRRTSTIADLKMLLVVPVTGMVFLAISAYREIPISSVKQVVPVILTQNSSSESKSVLMPPPPPPPPQSSEKKNNVKVAKKEKMNESDPEPFVVVEEMPMFPGGEHALQQYIADHTEYPEIAKENNIKGKVIVRFCVTSEGGVSQISVLKGVDPELDKEAIRVVNTLPTFKPGKQGGKPVPVWYMVPIEFALK
jgi:TonB family protein